VAYVIPCVRFNRAVSPSLGLQVSFRISVGDAVSSAIFNGLANTTATLGSFYWLGFETSGLSPDKKRLALLGAQRSSSGGGDPERHFQFGALSPSPAAACSPRLFGVWV
jgi:hypothetical protein